MVLSCTGTGSSTCPTLCWPFPRHPNFQLPSYKFYSWAHFFFASISKNFYLPFQSYEHTSTVYAIHHKSCQAFRDLFFSMGPRIHIKGVGNEQSNFWEYMMYNYCITSLQNKFFLQFAYKLIILHAPVIVSQTDRFDFSSMHENENKNQVN